MSSVTFSNQNFFFLSFSFLRLPFLFFLFVFFHYKNLVLEDCFAKFCLTLCHVKFFNLLFYVNEDENIMLVSDDGMSHLNTLNFVDICRRLLIQRNKIIFFFCMAQQPIVGQGLLIIEASPSHSDTPHSVGLLLTSDQPVAGTTTHNTHKRQTSMPPAVFEPAVPASERPQTHALARTATG